MEQTRRTFLKRTLLTSLAVGVIYPTVIEPFRLAVEKIIVQIDRLPAAFNGFRIAQISDLHYQPFTTLRQIRHVVEKINALDPDLIVITGDFITHHSEAIGDLAATLAGLRARYGVTGILGNHDHEAGEAEITKTLREAGMEILRNQGRELIHNGDRIYLAGVDSACNAHPNLPAALANRAGDLATILLAHEPDFVDAGPAAAGIDLQLSGHSHGGQVCLPFIGAPVLPDWGRKYWHGLHRVGRSQVYTNRGIGTIGLPIRVGSLPEITELILAGNTAVAR